MCRDTKGARWGVHGTGTSEEGPRSGQVDSYPEGGTVTSDPESTGRGWGGGMGSGG